MKNYYWDPEKQTAYYYQLQALDPDSDEYKKLLGIFFKEANLLINGVVNTHKLDRFEGKEDVISIAQETIITNIRKDKYDPTFLKKTGEPTDLFTYLSLAVKKSIRFYNLRCHYKRLKKPIDHNELNLINLSYEDNVGIVDAINYLRSLNALFKTRKYLLDIYNAIVDAWERDPTHNKKVHIVKQLSKRMDEFINAKGRKITTIDELDSYYNVIIIEIRNYKKTGRPLRRMKKRHIRLEGDVWPRLNGGLLTKRNGKTVFYKHIWALEESSQKTDNTHLHA